MSQIAEPGTSITIKPDESWTCTCGKEQTKPGAWVAAHWYEELTHTCQQCGVRRMLSRGVLSTPPARNIAQKEPTRRSKSPRHTKTLATR